MERAGSILERWGSVIGRMADRRRCRPPDWRRLEVLVHDHHDSPIPSPFHELSNVSVQERITYRARPRSVLKDEIREKYTFYCEGHLVNVPLE